MFRWLKRQFVPHEINGFRPLFLRRQSALRLAGALAVIELVLFVLPTLYFPQYAHHFDLGSVLPAVLSKLTNEERAKNNLPILAVSDKLREAAQLKANDMAAKSYFAHNSPEGRTPWYWFDLVGYRYAFAGENLAVNFSDSEEVTQAWMNSPTHQANIVGRNYTEVGTGIASGRYEGRETVFVVQLYGTPRPVAVSAPKSQVSTQSPKPAPKVVTQTPVKPVVKPTASSQLAQPAPAVVPTVATSAPQTEQVLGESVPRSSIEPLEYLKRLVASPKDLTNAVLYLALATVLIALFLAIAVKFEYQFPDLMANGAVVALLIIGIHLGNNYFSMNRLETSFIDFSQAEADVPAS